MTGELESKRFPPEALPGSASFPKEGQEGGCRKRKPQPQSDPWELWRMNEALENVYPAGERRRRPYSHTLLLSGQENEVASEAEGPVFQGKL